MNRNELINAKSTEVQKDLEAWCREHKLLAIGETIIFSMRIDAGPLVIRDEGDLEKNPQRLIISGQSRGKYRGVFRRPAVLTMPLLDDLLRRLPTGQSHEQFQRLFANGNNPTKIFGTVIDAGNRALKFPINDVYYRFARGSASNRTGTDLYQLWEVEPLSSK